MSKFEPFEEDLKPIFFNGTKCKIRFIYVGFSCKRKKCLEICAIKGGGGRRLMANTILNFHFDYRHTSLRTPGASHSRFANYYKASRVILTITLLSISLGVGFCRTGNIPDFCPILYKKLSLPVTKRAQLDMN